MKDGMSNNDESKVEKFIEVMRYQREVILAGTRKMFRLALLYGAVFVVIWTVIGKLIPPGNWLAAYNIIMLLISIFIMCIMFYNFFRARIDWGWLAAILTGITWAFVVIGIRTIIISLFY